MDQAKSGRRTFLKELSAGAAALPLAQSAFAQTSEEKKKNILFIVVDQLRMDCLGAFGNDQIETPHIDALAGDGVRFENSICAYPVCTPSRYSFLSGQYVHDHQGWSNHCTLASDIATFPKVLRAAGYKTKAVGKMHMTPTYLDVGFDDLLLSEQNGPGRWDDDFHRYLMERGLYDRNDLEDQEREYRKAARPEYWETCGALTSNLPEEHHPTTWVGDRTVEDLETWDDSGGRLLMASFIKPHHPFDPPAPWPDMYDPDEMKIRPGWVDECFSHDLEYGRGYFPHEDLNEEVLKRVTAYYYAAISHIDHHVGRMVESLKKRGLYEDTMIVFTADHGEYLGQHHLLLKGNLMYDALMKVPLIVKWPGNANAGTLSDRMVNNIDLAPTFCSAAGCAPGPDMSGSDLADGTAGPGLVFAESHYGKQWAVRSKTRKLIAVTDKARGGELRLYYDLEKDPNELTNLFDDPAYQAEARAMEKTLLEWASGGSMDIYLNEDEKQIARPNVPKNLDHREETIGYFRRKMGEA